MQTTRSSQNQIKGLFLGALLFMLFYLSSCASMGKQPVQVQQEVDPQLIELKRGRLKGPQYFNEYYQFQMTTPRGWRVNRPKTDFLMRMNPQDTTVVVELMINELKKEEPLELVAGTMAKNGNWQILKEEADTFLEQPAYIIEYLSGTVKTRAMFILRGLYLYEIYSRANEEAFAEWEPGFHDAISSIRFTDKLIEGVGQEDYFSYLVKPGDSLPHLAELFLNDPQQGNMISYFNQLTNLVSDRSIDIPRYVSYRVAEGDTAESISKKMYDDPGRFGLITDYNPHLDKADFLTPGTLLKVPMYFMYELKEDDTLAKLARQYLKSESRAELIYIYNGQTPMRPGNHIKMPIIWAAPNYILYTVKPNDSLASIAKNLTCDVNNYPKIAAINNIRPPFEIAIGQELRIPSELICDAPVKRPPSSRKPPEKKDEEKRVEEIEGPIYEPD